VGAAYGTFWSRRAKHAVLWWGNLKEGEHFEGLSVEGSTISKCTLKIGWEIIVWIDLAPYRDQALVNMTKKVWISLTLCRSYLKPYCMGRKAAFF
jgi:hypothetical protein